MDYVYHVLVTLGIYVVLAISLNLLVGYVGLLSLSHAAFYGAGAYATALFMMRFNLNFIVSLIAAFVVTSVIGTVVAAPMLRLRGDYFILGTFGFQIIAFDIMRNWDDVTGGVFGLYGVPHPKFGEIAINPGLAYVVLGAILTGVAILIFWRTANSPFGRVLKAIRDDEVVARSLGKNTATFKVLAFGLSAGVAAISGALLAGYIVYLDPSLFTVAGSILILTMVVVGGSGNLVGPVAGAVVLTVVPEALRFAVLPSQVAGPAQQTVYGLLVIAIMFLRPQGILGEFQMR